MNDGTANITNPLNRAVIRSGALPLVPGTSAWDLLEPDFLRVFVDHAERERALDGIRDPRTTRGIAMNVAATLLSPARGLPPWRSHRCIDTDSRENFEQWADTARKHQKNWM